MKKCWLLLAVILGLLSCKQTELVEIKNGNVLLEKFYQQKDGTLHGQHTTYYENGTPQIIENYEDGYLSGKRSIFYENGQVEIIEIYNQNVMEGKYQVFYEDGSTNIEANYVNGQMEGLLTAYYKNGTVKEEVTYIGSEENGPFKEFHPNGNLAWEGTYVNGDNEIGLLSSYNSEGILIKKMECDTFMKFSKCKTIWEAAKLDNEKN